MFNHLIDVVALRDVAVEHTADEVDTLLADDVWHSQIPIHYLVDAVKWIFLVDDGVKEDPESPHILLHAPVRLSCQYLWSGIICKY